MIQHQKKEKQKRGNFIFSSANSTNYANFLGKKIKWKKNPVQLNKKKKNGN